jgi:hypothetical protein
MWIFNAIANAIGRNSIGDPNYDVRSFYNRVIADGGTVEAESCMLSTLNFLNSIP